MQEQDGLNAQQQELELAMRSVVPKASRVDSAAAAFAAGRASGRRQMWFWRVATAIVLAAGIAVRLLPPGNRGAAGSADFPGSVVVVQKPPSDAPIPDQSVLMLQRAIDKQGAEGLPAARLCPVQSLHAGDVL